MTRRMLCVLTTSLCFVLVAGYCISKTPDRLANNPGREPLVPKAAPQQPNQPGYSLTLKLSDIPLEPAK